MKRLLPHVLWISGILLVLIAIGFGPGLPSQDPTPEMLAIETRQNRLSNMIAMVGLVVFVTGVLWAVARALLSRFSCKTAA